MSGETGTEKNVYDNRVKRDGYNREKEDDRKKEDDCKKNRRKSYMIEKRYL